MSEASYYLSTLRIGISQKKAVNFALQSLVPTGRRVTRARYAGAHAIVGSVNSKCSSWFNMMKLHTLFGGYIPKFNNYIHQHVCCWPSLLLLQSHCFCIMITYTNLKVRPFGDDSPHPHHHSSDVAVRSLYCFQRLIVIVIAPSFPFIISYLFMYNNYIALFYHHTFMINPINRLWFP